MEDGPWYNIGNLLVLYTFIPENETGCCILANQCADTKKNLMRGFSTWVEGTGLGLVGLKNQAARWEKNCPL